MATVLLEEGPRRGGRRPPEGCEPAALTYFFSSAPRCHGSGGGGHVAFPTSTEVLNFNFKKRWRGTGWMRIPSTRRALILFGWSSFKWKKKKLIRKLDRKIKFSLGHFKTWMSVSLHSLKDIMGSVKRCRGKEGGGVNIKETDLLQAFVENKMATVKFFDPTCVEWSKSSLTRFDNVRVFPSLNGGLHLRWGFY